MARRVRYPESVSTRQGRRLPYCSRAAPCFLRKRRHRCRRQRLPIRLLSPLFSRVAKVMPAVVNINAERVVRRQIRDPFEDFATEFFGTYRSQPREVRQRLQSLGSGFIVDPAGYIVTNEHVVQRAADLRIEVTTSDGKVYNAHYITGDPKKISRLSKSTARADSRSLIWIILHPIFSAKR